MPKCDYCGLELVPTPRVLSGLVAEHECEQQRIAGGLDRLLAMIRGGGEHGSSA